MKITNQSIEWLGGDEARITTTRSKGGRGFGFARIGPFGVGGKGRGKSAGTTEVIQMDREYYGLAKSRIERGKFRAYHPGKFYRYEDTDAAERAQRRAKRRAKRQERKRDRQARMDGGKVARRPPRTKWYWATVAATLCWAVAFVLASAGVPPGVGGVLTLVGWLVLPVAIFKDCPAATTHAPNWFPRRWVYVAGSLVPFVDFFVGALYLHRRRKYGRETEFDTPDTTPDTTESAA